MSVTPDTAVSINLLHREWSEVYEILEQGSLVGEQLAYQIGAQLPELTPTGLGAVVRAEPTNIGPNVLPVVLVFCSKGDSPQDKLSWRDPYEGSWYEPDDFHVTEVLSQGIPWPTA